MMRLPQVSGKHDFKKLCNSMRLRGKGGVDSTAKGGVYDVSNLDRIGKGEVDLVNMYDTGRRAAHQVETMYAKWARATRPTGRSPPRWPSERVSSARLRCWGRLPVDKRSLSRGAPATGGGRCAASTIQVPEDINQSPRRPSLSVTT